MENSETSSNENKSLDQRRAEFAYKAVASVRKEIAQEYATLARNLPVRLLQNGLGQTIAFLMSKAEGKAEKPHAVLLDQLREWLIKERRIVIEDHEARGNERLMSSLAKETDPNRWARAQEEAIVLASWLKRFTDALVPKDVKKQGEIGNGR